MTDRQKHFYKLYMSGYSMGQIARKYGINKSTVLRTIQRAEKHLRDAKETIEYEELVKTNDRNVF